MELPKLVQMANQIGAYFAAEPDNAVARDGVATHLRKFWDPRMRRALLAAFDAGQASGLSPLVTEAVRAHRDRL